MTENNQNEDEYQFDDLDAMSPESIDETSNFSKSTDASSVDAGSRNKEVIRNSMIAVALVLLSLVFYKFVSSFFHKKDEIVKVAEQVVPVTPVQTEAPVAPVTPPVPPAATIAPSDLSDLNQKLANLSDSQQNLLSQMNGLTGQLNLVNSNINSLNSKLTEISQNLSALSGRVAQQSSELSSWIEEQTRKKQVKIVKPHRVKPRMIFSIQAIIPGRAWLIAQNGSTLTVREGSTVPGYGSVKLIDPNQGRVVMSTGQIIRFSQQDS